MNNARLMRLLSVLAVALLLGWLLLLVLSWLLSAALPGSARSLLSGEGIRWFFGSFSQMVASSSLVWLLLLLSAWGCLRSSGLQSAVGRRRALPYRERIALRVSFAFIVIYVVILSLLVLMPHAILLSASGRLFPSAFSRALVPSVAFGLCLASVSFGVVSGRLPSLPAVLRSLSVGLSDGSPLIILYILLIQFIESLRFVFG